MPPQPVQRLTHGLGNGLDLCAHDPLLGPLSSIRQNGAAAAQRASAVPLGGRSGGVLDGVTALAEVLIT
jgi:hypothetical protein